MREDYKDVLIGTPVRDGRFHAAYVVGLMNSFGLHNGWVPNSGQSDIYISRNQVMNAFYLQEQYKTLVCIDSDIGFTRKQLKELIDSEGDIVSGIYTDKSQPPVPFCRDYRGVHVAPENIPAEGMIKSLMVPGGFYKVTRKALDKMVAAGHVPNVKIIERPGQRAHLFHTSRIYDDMQLSEDYSFSYAAMLSGVQCWTNCGIRVVHDGRSWDGKPVMEYDAPKVEA